MSNRLQRFHRARRQSGFPTFIPCQRQDANVLPKRRQSHQGDKLCDVSTVPLVARWPVFLARGSDADGEPHCTELWLRDGSSRGGTSHRPVATFAYILHTSSLAVKKNIVTLQCSICSSLWCNCNISGFALLFVCYNTTSGCVRDACPSSSLGASKKSETDRQWFDAAEILAPSPKRHRPNQIV